ncbi:MAG: geranylgeranylglyceryl/heptaprenylglyceryl phosphate synthase [Candidatus Bathyarchaeia archaeon]
MGDIRIGKVEKLLQRVIEEKGVVHLTLFDPEKLTPHVAQRLALKVKKAGTTAAMVGGSTVTSVYELDAIVRAIKTSKLPVILFPNAVSGLSQYADAIFFMSLLNSINPYYLSGAQALGAPFVKRYNLEPIPLAYLIVGEHTGAAGFVGNANPIPNDKPELASIYALAAEYFGMRFVYLEAGSGARDAVPVEMVRTVKKNSNIHIIVGGGIRRPSQAKALADAGAQVIVTGTLSEQASVEKVRKIIEVLR